MTTEKFSKLESRVGQVASRRAHRQLMQVPWDRFHKAYEEYIQWQGFALWARATVESESYPSARLKVILREHCPGFAEEMDHSNKPEPLGLQLLSWVHNRAFGVSRQEGWLDALVFYGFRDIRSQGYWAYWEHCEKEWRRQRPTRFPDFPQWRRAALSWKLQGDLRCAAIAKAVEEYVDFEAIVYWLHPLFRVSSDELPTHVTRELKQECPGLLEFVNTYTRGTYLRKARNWQRLFNWGKEHVLWRAEKEGWLDIVLRQTHSHPLHVRLVDYTDLWSKSQRGYNILPYPSLRQWRKDAENYVRGSRKRGSPR
jgi:hypothetical protein